jgi:hypothetical protein
MSSWVVVTGKQNAGARRQLGSVQSADIQLIKTKQQHQQQASKDPTDRPGPTHKTTASYLSALFLFNWPDSPQSEPVPTNWLSQLTQETVFCWLAEPVP